MIQFFRVYCIFEVLSIHKKLSLQKSCKDSLMSTKVFLVNILISQNQVQVIYCKTVLLLDVQST